MRGATLLITLVLLTIMTIVGISSSRNIGVQENLAVGSYDRATVLQLAEAALREAEQLAQEQSDLEPSNLGFINRGLRALDPNTCPPKVINTDCQNGLCSQPYPHCAQRWSSDEFTGWVKSEAVMQQFDDMQAEYFIEYLGGTFACTDGASFDPQNCKRYRISARNIPPEGRARVVLQTVYAAD